MSKADPVRSLGQSRLPEAELDELLRGHGHEPLDVSGDDPHPNLHVRGYKESGTTTTPFEMVVRNDLDHYRLVMDVIDRVPGLAVRAAAVRQSMADARTRHHVWIREHGADLPEVADWAWDA